MLTKDLFFEPLEQCIVRKSSQITLNKAQRLNALMLTYQKADHFLP